MIFHTNRNELLEALTITGSVIGTNTLVPIVSNYLFKLANNRLEITGSSMDVYIKNVIDVSGDLQEACIAVPKSRIFDLLKDLPSQPIKLEISSLKSKSPKLTITSVQGEYIIPIEDGAAFPKMVLSNTNTISVSSANLLAGLDRTTHSCSDDQLRPAITGVLFEIKPDCIAYVSTNTNILSTITVPITDGLGIESNFIIPVKALKIIQNMPVDEMVQMEVSDNNVQFVLSPEITVQSILINERYPAYQTVIPNNYKKHFTLDRSELLSSVKRVSKFSNPQTTMVSMNIKPGGLEISSIDVDLGNQALEKLCVEYSGDELEIGLSGKFLISILNRLKTDQISISVEAANRAAILKEVDENLILNSKENLILLMPMLLTQ